MKISEYFNINLSQYELDFIDINFEEDTPLFLDPYCLSLKTDKWSLEAHATLQNFFNYILYLFKNGDYLLAQSLFRFSEPYETCLGVSIKGVSGKGIGTEEATKLFESLLKSRVLERNIINNLGDIKIFVDNVGHDKISDLCTNIIRKHLIDYTLTQCELYNLPTKLIATNEYWNAETKSWISTYEKMLVINDKPLILVPKSIVCRKQGYYFSPEKYSQHFVLNFLKSKELRLNSELVKSKVLKNGEIKQTVNKEDVAKKYNARSKDYLRNFTQEHPEYFEKFKETADNQIKSLSNQEILNNYSIRLIEDIIDRLIRKFDDILPGRPHADEYHNHVLACMNLLFYPSLTKPVKEQNINKGRKRVDILYTNEATEGYFFNLPNVRQIPSMYIFVECKNYSTDIANIELDQINGRFNVNFSKVGFITFRKCENYELIIERCRDYFKSNRNLIIPIRDEDFISMLNRMKETLMEQDKKFFHEQFLYEITKKIIVD